MTDAPITINVAVAPVIEPAGPNAFLDFCRQQPLGAASFVMIFVMMFAGIFSEWVSPYNPIDIDFAAILQPPFFEPTADDAVNYGAIGAVIGHEIGNAFDDRGRRFDSAGTILDWWTPGDDQEFRRRVQGLVDHYNRYSALPGVLVNGSLTLGENIGDLAGLQVAYRAYSMSRGGKPAPVIDGLTGDQRFFMGWARVWRSKDREAYLRQMVLTSPHPPNEFRANGPLSHIDAFYEAFDVRPGDKLYVEPEKRVRIW